MKGELTKNIQIMFNDSDNNLNYLLPTSEANRLLTWFLEEESKSIVVENGKIRLGLSRKYIVGVLVAPYEPSEVDTYVE